MKGITNKKKKFVAKFSIRKNGISFFWNKKRKYIHPINHLAYQMKNIGTLYETDY